ncbi:MAG TPA: TIGR03790 family protein [Vicinamibacterales bacterium]|nr:TIGR03790 family protein [Vicinamibacterales bacterium]
MRCFARSIGLLATLLALPRAAYPQSADNVAVVINDASPASVQIGEYYAKKRAIAQDHVLHIKTATTDDIERGEFSRTIQSPLGEWLGKSNLQDKILYIVLTKGVPIRITGTQGLQGSGASVDSELTLLYRRMVGTPQAPIAGRLPNPYFLDQKAIADAKPFTRFLDDIYLVTRLDGYTVDDVLKLIDRGTAPSTDGKIVLDERATLMDAGGDRWLQQAADRLRQTDPADRVVLEMTRSLVTQTGPILGYYSWGSNDTSNRLRHFGMQFSPGAIGAMFVSTDGRTFAEPPADWIPGGTDKRGYGSQSLAGDLIRDGITGVAAHVNEPFLDATIRPQILFPAYIKGFNLAESFYLAMPYLSWQTIVVGDPLCVPFPRQTLSADQIAKDIDPDTGLPGLYSERRVAMLASGGINVQAVKLMLKAENSFTRGDEAGGEKAFEDAFRLEPRLATVAVRLGGIYETRQEYSKSVDLYRKALAASPGNPVLMNNLAYGLAEYQHNPTDALPLAEKAYAATKLPVIADTLAWIHHLMGNDQLAAPLIDQALPELGSTADVQMHAAFVHAALGDKAKAQTELAAALKLDAKLGERADVKALQEKLK